MSADNKQIVRAYIETVINTGNTEHIADFLAPDYTEVFNNHKYRIGIEGAREHVMGVRATYSDLHLSIEMQIAEGDWVATCYTMRGIHTGAWMDIPPTGKPIEVTGVNIDKVLNGRIVEHGGAANLLGVLLDIGAVQIPDALPPES